MTEKWCVIIYDLNTMHKLRNLQHSCSLKLLPSFVSRKTLTDNKNYKIQKNMVQWHNFIKKDASESFVINFSI